MQFYLGAHGQGAMHAMSDNPLKNAPDDNPAFAELGRLFDVNPVDAGVAAFETVMDHQEGGPVDATAPGLFQILAVGVGSGGRAVFGLPRDARRAASLAVPTARQLGKIHESQFVLAGNA